MLALAKSMIEKTMASGFMARHLLHWAKPDNPSYNEFFFRTENVDDTKKEDFLASIRNLWAMPGNERADPKKITQ